MPRKKATAPGRSVHPDGPKSITHVGKPSGAKGDNRGVLHKRFASPPKHNGDISGT